MTASEKKIFNDALKYWGEEDQKWMAIEEMAELIKAIAKFRRNPCDETFNNVCDEIADVRIMVDQIELMMGPGAKMNIERIRNHKIERLDKRIDEHLRKTGIDPGIRNPKITRK